MSCFFLVMFFFFVSDGSEESSDSSEYFSSNKEYDGEVHLDNVGDEVLERGEEVVIKAFLLLSEDGDRERWREMTISSRFSSSVISDGCGCGDGVGGGSSVSCMTIS